MVEEVLHIKNMICTCCIKLLKMEFENAGVKTITIRAGYANIQFDNEAISLSEISKIIENLGMELIKSRDQKFIDQIKIAVIELIHHSNNVSSIVRKSEYLVEKLGLSYQHLSKLFSKHESITLERYIILNSD